MHNAKPGRRKTLLQKPAQPPREAQQQVLQENRYEVQDLPVPELLRLQGMSSTISLSSPSAVGCWVGQAAGF